MKESLLPADFQGRQLSATMSAWAMTVATPMMAVKNRNSRRSNRLASSASASLLCFRLLKDIAPTNVMPSRVGARINKVARMANVVKKQRGGDGY